MVSWWIGTTSPDLTLRTHRRVPLRLGPSPDDKNGGEPKFSAWRAFSQGSPPFHFPSFGTLRPSTAREDRFAWQRGGNTERDCSLLGGASRRPPASKLSRASRQMRGGAAQGAARRCARQGGAARGVARAASGAASSLAVSRGAARRRGARRAEPRRFLPRDRSRESRRSSGRGASMRAGPRRSPRAEAQLGGVARRCARGRVVVRRVIARGSPGSSGDRCARRGDGE